MSICYDAATSVFKGLELLTTSEDRHPKIPSFKEEQLDSHDASVSLNDTEETANDSDISAFLSLFVEAIWQYILYA